MVNNITVTLRDGTREAFDADRVNKSIARACEGLSNIPQKVVQIASEMQLTLYDGITEEDLDIATINAALQNVQEDIEYDKVAMRLLLKMTYKRVLGDYKTDEKDEVARMHKEQFADHIRTGVKNGLLDTRMEEKYDLDELANYLDTTRDDNFLYSGLSTLLHRYSLKGENEQSAETPQFAFMRIAMGLSYNEENPTEQAKKFYDKYSRLEYLPGGSTNLMSGTVRPSLSNCFLIEMQDDMEHIAKTTGDVLLISKATGGIGLSLTQLRATGSNLKSSNTVSSGPTPFAKIIDVAIRAIMRGGKKKGACALYMEPWHYDFMDFLDWRHNAGDDHLRMRTASTAAILNDEFMKRVRNNDEWYFFDPNETRDLIEAYGAEFSKLYNEYIQKAEAGELKVWKKAKANEVYRKQLVAMQGTSHPWMTWKGPINTRALNNNTGAIKMSNLCTEICLPQDRENIAVCNLASLNIARHIDVQAKTVDWQRLEESVRTAIRHLDNLIDINQLPVAEAEKSDKENRAVGLGVMGLADAFEKMGMAFDSEEAYDFADQVFEFISYMAIDASAELAQERGSYQNFAGSRWSKGMVPVDTLDELEKDRGMLLTVDKTSKHKGLDWDRLRKKVKVGMRNATVMAVAPNANIGLLAGTTPGTDVRFAQAFSRNKFSGKYLDLNHNLVNELKELGLWDKLHAKIIEHRGDIADIAEIPQRIRDIYKTSFSTSPYGVIEVTARAQKWVDQAISRNMYLETRDVNEMMKIYATAWEKGLKTTYYLHMKPRHSAEQSTVKVNKAASLGKRGFAALHDKTKAAEPVPAPVQVSEQQLADPVLAMAGGQGATAEAAGAAAPAAATAAKKEDAAFVCPVDPALRNQCDSCQ